MFFKAIQEGELALCVTYTLYICVYYLVIAVLVEID